VKTFSLTTPVALLVFNRPDVTSRVFSAIREAQPRHFLVIADGPRNNRPDDLSLCMKVRQIVEQVDWPCQVEYLYSETNLGCRKRVSSGLDWVFNIVDEAIILEDDCLPDQTFFRYCQEMLNLYRHDERIMMISGSNLLGEWKAASQNYHFSCYGGVWGWASWRRAWSYYDVEMPLWRNPEIRDRVRDVIGVKSDFRRRAKAFDKTASGKIDTWDYQWSFARLMQSGLTIVPSVNLISNIGFGQDATHTKNARASVANLDVSQCNFPLVISPFIAVDRDYDAAFLDKVMNQQTLLGKIMDALQIIFGIISGQNNDRA
jgi:hypothetical protein